jgi:hypothetical protein
MCCAHVCSEDVKVTSVNVQFNKENPPNYRDFYSRTFLVRVGIIAILGSIFLAVTGPFNTYSQGGIVKRFAFWSVVVFVSLGLAGILKPLAWRFFPKSRILREIVTVAAFVPVFLPLLLTWIDAMFPSQDASRTSVWYLLVNVFIIAVIVSMCIYLLPLLVQHRSRAISHASSDQLVPFLAKRLPEEFDGEVLRLSGDGHYVNVTTSHGTFDIRMRLSDAVGEMTGVPGFWTHRSHWVASHAIRDWRKLKSGKTVLVLNNSDEVPVTAKYQPDLEEAGFVLRRGIETENA